MPTIIAQILTWGRQQSAPHTTDTAGHFSRSETDSLRRHLRGEYAGGSRAVCGDWRRGYEMAIGDERVGVTNGYGNGFRVYYRKAGNMG